MYGTSSYMIQDLNVHLTNVNRIVHSCREQYSTDYILCYKHTINVYVHQCRSSLVIAIYRTRGEVKDCSNVLKTKLLSVSYVSYVLDNVTLSVLWVKRNIMSGIICLMSCRKRYTYYLNSFIQKM